MALHSYEHRLYPNESSQVGFLVPGQKLEQILADDAKVAAKHGVTLYQVGCVLERLVYKHNQGDYDIDGIYHIIPGLSTCGYQECPFKELDPVQITYGRSTIVVEKITTGERFVFESLVAHLVKDHGFCEGPGTPYRLDLEGAIRFFDIRPEIDYTPQCTIFSRWNSTGSGSGSDVSDKYRKLKPLALTEFTSKYFMALLFPISLPSNFEMTEDSTPFEALYQGLLKSETKSNQFRLEVGFPVKSPEKIEEMIQSKMEKVKYRTERFREGIHEKGLVLVIVASTNFKYEKNGLIAIPMDAGSAQFQIPELSFDITEKYFRIPSYHIYTLSQGICYH